MKYRDLIAVVCLVALVMLGLSNSPGGTVEDTTEAEHAAVATPVPVEASVAVASPTPMKTKASVNPERLEKKNRFSRPQEPSLSLEVTTLGNGIEGLELQAKITAKEELTLNLNRKDEPIVDLMLNSKSDKYWHFRSGESHLKKKTFAEGESVEWFVRPSSLIYPDDIAELQAIYGKEPLVVSISLFDGGQDDANPFSRQLVRQFHQSTNIPAFLQDPR